MPIPIPFPGAPPPPQPSRARRTPRVSVNIDLQGHLNRIAQARRFSAAREAASTRIEDAKKMDAASSLAVNRERDILRSSLRASIADAKAGPAAERDTANLELALREMDAEAEAPTEGFNLLKLAAKLPGIIPGLQAAEMLAKTGGAQLMSGRVGPVRGLGSLLPFTPAQREMEQRRKELAEGKGVFDLKGQFQAQAQAFEEQDLPSITVPISPFAIPIPSIIAGPNKTIKDVQFGVKGALELAAMAPVDLAAGLGIGKAVRMAATPLKSKLAAGVAKEMVAEPWRFLQPGTPQWRKFRKAHPNMQPRMDEIARRVKQNLNTETSGPASPPPPKGTLLEKMMALPKMPQKVTEPLGKLPDAYRRIKLWGTDRFVTLSEKTDALRAQWLKEYGEEIPLSVDSIAQAHLMAGAEIAAIEGSQQAIRNMNAILQGVDGPAAMRPFLKRQPVDDKYVTQYLQLKHNEEVLKMAQFSGRRTVLDLKDYTADPKLYPKGKGFTVNLKDIRESLRTMAATVGPQDMAKIDRASRVIVDFYDEYLEREVVSGLVSRGEATFLRKRYRWYNPIKYREDVGQQLSNVPSDIAAAGVSKAFSVSKSSVGRLSETGSALSQIDPLKLVHQVAIQREILIRRNDAAKSIVLQALSSPEEAVNFRRVPTGLKASIMQDVRKKKISDIYHINFMRNGKKVTYEAPQWAPEMANAFAQTPLGSWSKAAQLANSGPRAILTQYNPGFWALNLVHDTFLVAATQGVMPWDVALNVVKNIKAIVKHDAGMAHYNRSGAGVGGFAGEAPRQIARKAIAQGNLPLQTLGDWDRVFARSIRRPWEMVSAVGHAIENGPRRAVFESKLRKGLDPERAALMARRSTVDFARGGYGMMAANNFFLYLNAAVQGTILPFRAVRFGGRAPWTARFGIASYALAEMGIYGWNRQFPEYYDTPLHDRWGRTTISMPSTRKDKFGKIIPNSVAIIPQLREFAVLSSVIKYVMEKVDGENPEAVSALVREIIPHMNPFESMFGQAVPTFLAAAIMEVKQNRDNFRKRPIVPEELRGLPSPQQFDQNTSEMAIRLGRHFNWSPMAIDHLTKTGLGRDIVAGADAVLRVFDGDENVDIEGIVAFLEDLGELAAQEDIPRLRRIILADLDSDVRERVELAERTREPGIPLVSSIQARFMKKSAGYQHRLGVEIASKKIGLTPEAIQYMTRRLGATADELQSGQEDRDDLLDAGEISSEQWRGARQEDAKLYGATMLSVGQRFPQAAEFWSDSSKRAEFYDDVHTLAGSIPDTRGKGQLLLAAYRSIPVPEIAPGIEDWPAYFRAVEQFMGTLSKEEEVLLKKERAASDTEMERKFNEMAQSKLMQQYWNIHEDLLENDPERIATYEVYRSVRSTFSAEHPEVQMARQMNPWMDQTYDMVNLIRQQMRENSPDIDAFLWQWGYSGLIKTPEVMERQDELNPWAARQRQTLAQVSG